MRFPRRVTTVVLNYREVADTVRCAESVRRSTHLDQSLVVVDNGGDEATTSTLRRQLPDVSIISSSRNLGYAGGNNLGIQAALDGPAAYVWLLNPDTVVEPDAVEQMVAVAESRPDAGIVGSRLLVGGDPQQRVWFDGGNIDWEQAGGTSHRGAGIPYAQVADDMDVRPIDYATGASMLVRREVFEDVGLLPEEYFLYFEETHFNVQARGAGWSVVLAPRAVVHHHQRSHGVLPSPHYIYYFVRNRLVFGSTFTGMSPDEVLPHAQAWIDAWRDKVTRRAPDWLPVYEDLVGSAIDDARAGRMGPRDDIASVQHPGGARVGS